MGRLAGRATTAGTARYAARFADVLDPGHFRDCPAALTLSSLGLGSYLGEPDDATDRCYAEVTGLALRSGVNVLDAAINYRHMRSERSLGRALAAAVEQGEVARDEVVVASKAGFIAFDGAVPADPRGWFSRTYLLPGILGKDDVVAGMHAMNPGFLADQLERSLDNLGLETIDVYYLHNPETQRPEVGPERFRERMRAAFGFLEQQVAAGRIAVYALATWNGLLMPPERPDHLDLAELLGLAREVVGEEHHLRVIQLPLNAAMTAAATARVQGGRTILEAAADAGLVVMASAAIHQGRLAAQRLPALAEPGLETPAQQALQFARSAPGVTTALVGSRDPRHLRENLAVAQRPPVAAAGFAERFGAILGG